MHNHPSIPLDSESTQMFSHLLAASQHCEFGGGGRAGQHEGTEQSSQSGRDGWESPVPAKRGDLQRADLAHLEF